MDALGTTDRQDLSRPDWPRHPKSVEAKTGTLSSMPRGPDNPDPLESALAGSLADALQGWEELQGDTPALLYHYTDVTGLIGICASRSLRATNLRFMNDAKELSHAWKLMRRVLAEAKEQATLSAQHDLIDEIERATSTEWAGYPDFYSVSFTANGDLLSQWRGYGSSGDGYAIGFDPEGQVQPPSPYPQPKRFLHRVIYDEDVQLRFLRMAADAMLALFATVDPADPAVTESRARVFSAMGELVGFAFGFKDPAWAEEQEWRAVHVRPSGELAGVEFRPDKGVVMPYISLAMGTDPEGRLPIRHIVQGPRVNSDIAIRSLELLLTANGYSDVDITVSSVPLRP